MPRKKNPKDATYLVETAMKLRSDAILISVHLGSFLKKRHPLRAEADNMVKVATALHVHLKDEFPEPV
jgi:hypothetical protein